MTIVILAEKPSQALAYAQAFQKTEKKDGYFTVTDSLFPDETTITFGFGHLVEDIQPTEKAEEKLKEEEKQKKKSQQNSEKQAMVHESETQQEIKKEESKTISIHPKLYELVNINKKQVLIDDPDYATHKINEEKRKVNKIVSDNAGALETEINQVFQEQLSILDRQREAKLIAYQNELLSSSDPKELLSIFAEKDSEIHEQKKEAIFNLNEQENKAIEELEKRFEIEKEQLRLEFLSKKNKAR